MKHTTEVILDTEGSGLDPNVHENLEFTGKKRFPGTTKPPVILTFKIKPDRIEAADPKALEVNGYTEEAWAEGLSQHEAITLIMEFIQGSVIIGQNIAFDMDMIKAACRRTLGWEYKQFAYGMPHHRVDVASLAYEHLYPLGLRKPNGSALLSLKHICLFLGISNEGEHTSLADVTRTEAAYDKLNRASFLKKLWWRWAGPRRLRTDPYYRNLLLMHHLDNGGVITGEAQGHTIDGTIRDLTKAEFPADYIRTPKDPK